MLVDEIMYWTTNWTASTGKPSVEKAWLNGSDRTAIYSDSSAVFTGITLIDDALYLSDGNSRLFIIIIIVDSIIIL